MVHISITMKTFTVLVMLAATIVVNIDAADEDFKFQLLDPHGYRVSFKPTIQVAEITLHGVISDMKEGTLIGRFAAKTEIRRNGWFFYQNTSTPVIPGHVVYFWVHIKLPNLTSYSTAVRTYVVP